MSALRELALLSAYESVISKANFRRPQHEAFQKFHELIRALGRDIPSMSAQDIAERISDLGYSDDIPADLIFDLATGVGKTRLMGGILVYLARSRQSRNCLILASRNAILEKLKRESDPASTKYLFLDKSLISDPNLCFRGDLQSFDPHPARLNVFVLSPQTLLGTKVGLGGDFGPSIRKYLTEVDDLIVFSDEAHHIVNKEAGAWREAVAQLNPKLHLGFTATVPKISKKKVLHSYDLNACLKEAKYTKAVKLWVEPKPEDVSEDDWDRQTIDFALSRAAAKRAAIENLRDRRPEFPDVNPIVLIAARDIAHAERVAAWLKSARSFDEHEVHVAHSGTKAPAPGKKTASSEEAIARLVSVDSPGSKIRVVVNVFQLSEGWDVTNVWVIAPLRSLATFTNAIQTIGRGLRLPAGRRVGEEEVDTLDVLCFGKEDFGSIVDQAVKEFGSGPDGSSTVGIVTRTAHEFRKTELRTISPAIELTLKIPRVVRTPGEPELDFSPEMTRGISSFVEVYDVGSGEFGSEDGAAVRRPFDAVVRSATTITLDGLHFLDPLRHTAPVRKIITRVLTDLGGAPGRDIATDPLKLALGVMDSIRTRYRATESAYEAEGVDVELTLAPVTVSVPVDVEAYPKKNEVGAWS